MWNLVNNPLKTSTLTLRGLCHNLPMAMNKRHLVRASIKAFYLTGSLDEVWFRACLVAQMVKNLPANAGDLGLIPGLGRSPGERNNYPLQWSCLDNPMDRGAYSPRGRKESDTTEWLTLSFSLHYLLGESGAMLILGLRLPEYSLQCLMIYKFFQSCSWEQALFWFCLSSKHCPQSFPVEPFMA